jgi:hypothetical protein
VDTLTCINKKRSYLIVFGLLSFAVLQTGCLPDGKSNVSSEVISAQATSNLESDTSQNAITAMQKIYVDEAVLEDIKPHKVECHQRASAHKQQICIQICHVPPGNPVAAQSKVIPLQALKAHLSHGNNETPADGDYLGLCSSEEVDDSANTVENETPVVEETPVMLEDPPIDNSADTVTSTTPSTDTTTNNTTDTSSNIPIWCQAYIDIDNNCDGYDDITGDPLL